MSQLPSCPQCGLENTYPDGDNLVCADCGFEWPAQTSEASEEEERIVRDANGTILNDGDARHNSDDTVNFTVVPRPVSPATATGGS